MPYGKHSFKLWNESALLNPLDLTHGDPINDLSMLLCLFFEVAYLLCTLFFCLDDWVLVETVVFFSDVDAFGVAHVSSHKVCV